MQTFKFSQFGSDLGTRMLGEQVRNQLLPLIQAMPTGEKLILDFQDVSVVANSFADECLAKLLLDMTLKELKERGLWVYGTAADGANDLWHTDFSGPVALVIGSEGDGMGRLVRECCDFIVSLPMKGQISSLNASNAAAITMYEILRQRMAKSDG